MHVDHLPCPGPGSGSLSLVSCPTCRIHVRIVGDARLAVWLAEAVAHFHQRQPDPPEPVDVDRLVDG